MISTCALTFCSLVVRASICFCFGFHSNHPAGQGSTNYSHARVRSDCHVNCASIPGQLNMSDGVTD
jgi:hypothetical protein